MNKLLEAMQMSRIEAKAAKFFDRMAEVDLLIIEDFGMKILDGQQLLDFMELIEDRHARKSTIITSQLPIKNWYDILAKNTTVADAVLVFMSLTMASFSCALKKFAVTRLSNYGTNIYGFFWLVPGLQLEAMLFFYFSLLSCSSSKRMRLVSSSTDGSWS